MAAMGMATMGMAAMGMACLVVSSLDNKYDLRLGRLRLILAGT